MTEKTPTSKLQVEFKDAIEKQIKTGIKRELDAIDDTIASAARAAVGELLGVRYDWGKWEFDPHTRVNGNEVQGRSIRAAIANKADELAPTLVDKALEEPLRFTSHDVNKLRSILKEEVLEATADILRQKARAIASEYFDES